MDVENYAEFKDHLEVLEKYGEGSCPCFYDGLYLRISKISWELEIPVFCVTDYMILLQMEKEVK